MDVSDAPKHIHLALFSYHMWGHQRGLCSLAARMVHAQPVHITHLAPSSIITKITEELDKYFQPGEEHLRELIHVVGLTCSPSQDFAVVDDSFAHVYELLAAGKPVSRSDNIEETYEGISPPTLIIMDALAWKPFNIVRLIGGDSVKIFTWASGAMMMTYVSAVAKDRGGLYGDIDEQLMRLIASGLSREELTEAVKKIWIRTQGDILRLPGLPEIFDYECFPQNVPQGSTDALSVVRYVYKFVNQSDGLIAQTSPYLEEQVIDAWKEWYGSRPVFTLAPLGLPKWAAEAETIQARRTSDLFVSAENFLDAALQKYGRNSVVYVSFGSEHWTTSPEMLWTFLDTMIKLKMPFVFSHASPLAQVPEEQVKKWDESGLVFHSKWLPQSMILNHEATGWFVTHCGQNGVLETLSAGVPCICWPLSTDQPFTAARLTELGVAYELFEVRNSVHGVRPSLRLDGKSPSGNLATVRSEATLVLGRAFGPDGRLKRKKAEEIREQLGQCWDIGGHCYNEIRRLISHI